MRPEFVDNRDGNTLAAAIGGHLDWLRETRKDPVSLDVATGYFNPGAFGMLANRLERLDKFRLLLGTEHSPAIPPRRKRIGEKRGHQFDDEQFRKTLEEVKGAIRDELNLLGFTEETDALLRRLAAFLRSGRADVRLYAKRFLHGKAFLFMGDEGVLSGSSNFTAAGLGSNLELNLGRYEPHVTGKVREWFDQHWNEAEPYDLAALIEARYQEYPPYLVYLRALLERYGDDLRNEKAAEGTPGHEIRLTTFQNDGLDRARRILEKFHGVLIADGVGLGKTYLGGELIRQASQDFRQSVLLVSPAALRDGTWRTFGDRHRLYLENVSFEEMAASKFALPAERYSMVVVDEAHAFRNPDTDRARALRRLLQGTPPKKLVLMSATPVNNSLWDLYYLLTYFVGHDAVFADAGIPSLKDRFAQASRMDPYDLRPDLLFDLLDRVTVRRTRNFVKRHYPNEEVEKSDGTRVRIKFPVPRALRLDYQPGRIQAALFKELEAALDPPSGPPKLTMARYVPSLYLKKGQPVVSQVALAGLLRSGLLKRFESSVHSFSLTCETMAKAHDTFLAALDKGIVPTPELLQEMDEDTASDETWERLIEEFGGEEISLYRADALRTAAESDRDLLRKFSGRAATVTRSEDPKLEALKTAILGVLRDAEQDAGKFANSSDLRKVLIFTYFEDTVDWIVPFLKEALDADPRFASYRGRLVSVAGRQSREGVGREDAVFGFAPRSAEAPEARQKDRFDVLVATDVLAEGLNLQQARNIINYDLPWNPMRLVQRHGRIDRIGSVYPEVFLHSFFPAAELDEMLDLEERLRKKIAQAAATIGMESGPLPGSAGREVSFAETREEIKALHAERSELFENAGERESALSGEEYRQLLRKGLDRFGRDELYLLPWGAGSGFASGQETGWFFCIRVLDRSFLRFVPADPKATMVKDSLRCLSLIHCTMETPRAVPPAMMAGVYEAWRKAKADVLAEWRWATDPKNLQPAIPRGLREIGEHLREHPPVGLAQPAVEEALRTIEAPWGPRIVRELRSAIQSKTDPKEQSAAVVARTRELGLLPYAPPPPLDVIEEEEVSLVCWMAVSK